MKFIFQNENWIVVDKASGVLTVPSRFQEKDSRPVLGLQLQQQVGKQVFPVHRLDFEVSGIVLWALNAQSHRSSQNWFEHKKIQKTYRALSLKQDFSHWPANLKKEDALIDEKTMGAWHLWKCKIAKGKRRSFESDHGLASVTEAKIIDYDINAKILKWDLRPITGRSHQLRFEMSRHGFPILGDHLYGSKMNSSQNPQSLALRAYKLDLSQIAEKERAGLPVVLEIESKIGDFE